MLKKSVIAVALLTSILMGGCSNKAANVFAPPAANIVSGTVYDNTSPVLNTSVLVMLKSGQDIELTTDSQGAFSTDVADGERVIGLAAAVSGKYGTVTTGSFSKAQIFLNPVPVAAPRASPNAVMQDLWFGVYDTNSSGDVRFRYQYTYSRFYCINWMPNVFPYTISPDPNRWTSWDLTDFTAPWKGKKLLVPTRYRWWHGAVYGYSISQALVLIATR